MNCFEARQEFPALWRKTASAERHAELMAHLERCAKCDHAFRVFAMTAPALHSEGLPAGARAGSVRREILPSDRPSRFAGAARVAPRPRRWLAMSAAAAIFVLGTSAAYFSARVPGETLDEAFSSSESSLNYETATELFESEMPPASNDLAS